LELMTRSEAPRKPSRAEVHLLGVGPDLTFRDPLNAPAKQAEVRVREAEYSSRTRAEGADHQRAVVGLSQKNFRDRRMGEMKSAHSRHLVGNFDGMIERENYNLHGCECHRAERIESTSRAVGDAELRAPAQGAGQQMRLHTVGDLL